MAVVVIVTNDYAYLIYNRHFRAMPDIIIMSNYINYLATAESFWYFWEKYRPAFLKLMMASAEGPQKYKFSTHEVRAASPKDKGALTFTLTVHKGKAVNDIRTSPIAKDLMRVLQQSRKALELSESSPYEFKLDRYFVLHVARTDVQNEQAEKPQSVANENIAG